ncbi:MAG: hypothetical protein JWQ96_1392, partial [Segetibacter sp.]|nr:hypothetical protein [Segetibacter sp.]
MKLLNRYCIIFLLLVCNAALAQSFTTRVSSKTIGKRDVLQVEYVGQNVNLSDFRVPSYSNWTVIAGPNFSSNRMDVNGVVTQETVYSLMIQPRAIGKLVIPGATAVINNKLYKSNQVLIVVKNVDHISGGQPAAPPQMQGSILDQLRKGDEEYGNDQFLRKGEDPREKIKNNVLVKAEVSKRTCFVGEPILVTYKLCTRLRSQSRVTKQPTFSGSTVIEMTTEDPIAKREVINGKPYNTYVIRRVQLFPLQEGKLELPAAQVENKITFYRAGDVSFRDLYYNSPASPVDEQTVVLASQPLTVDVRALPEPDVASYSGAIGKFDISVSTVNKPLETNNTLQLQVNIVGEGNLQQIKLPAISWPAGIEGFDPTEQAQEDKTHFPLRNKKTISFPFVVSKPGRYKIPGIEFTYFDPALNKFVSKTTQPLLLAVAKGTKPTIISNPLGSDLEGFQTHLYIILGAALLAVIIGLVWFQGKSKPQPQVAAATPGATAAPVIQP